MARIVKRPILTGITHGVSGYRKGCGCGVCRTAKSRQRQAETKAANQRRIEAAALAADPDRAERVAAEAVAAAVEQRTAESPVAPERIPGPVEQAVLDDLPALDGIAMQGTLRATALALAREIDERAGPSVASAARQLLATSTEIRKAAAKDDDELAGFLKVFAGGPS